jgi:ribosomal protein S12 methylthiotransferase accessory factor
MTALDAGLALAEVVRRLGDAGQAAYAIDLTRPVFAIPVARVVAPGLQLDPCQFVTPRLARAIDATGGGDIASRGVALL